MKKKSFNVEAALRGAIRRVFSRSPVVREVLMKVRREVPKFNNDGRRAKRDAVQYKCNVCNAFVSSTKVSVDHIEPVISVEDGFQDFNLFIKRLFCAESNLQVICDTCHDKKTYEERIARLTKQYTEELDTMETLIKGELNAAAAKAFKKTLAKYIAKKKAKGLEPIAQRALRLRDMLLKYK